MLILSKGQRRLDILHLHLARNASHYAYLFCVRRRLKEVGVRPKKEAM